MTRSMRLMLPVVLLFALGACRGSHFEQPEPQGPLAMVDDGGQPRLWLLSKQEEVRQVGVGGGTRSSTRWRSDTFFHFAVHAYDPLAAKPLWNKTLLTFGDTEAKGTGPSRVIGSAVDARLLGQDGAVVWLLIGAQPFAVSAHDGSVIADAAGLQQRNPELQGLLPSDAKFYGFDQGLVLTSADARHFVIRGAKLKASAYTPPPPAVEPLGPLRANGTHRTVPMRPLIGEAPERHVTLAGQWLGLYSEKEAADAADDTYGDNLLFPYSVLDEGAMARRGFWRAKIVTEQKFDDRFERFAELTPIADAPTFLNGRFVKDPQTDAAFAPTDPAGVLVFHDTRVDSAGRVALTRLDADLKTRWTTPLPLSRPDFIDPVRTWLQSGHLVMTGDLETQADGVTRRELHLVSVRLADGAMRAFNLSTQSELP
jgi:hypothetical protein